MSPQEKPKLDRIIFLSKTFKCSVDQVSVDPDCPDIYFVPGGRVCWFSDHVILVPDQPGMTSDKAWSIAAATVAAESKRVYEESKRHLGSTLKDAFEGRRQFKPKKREKRTIVVNRLDDKANKKRHKELAAKLRGKAS